MPALAHDAPDVRALVRRQLRLALVACLLLATGLGGLPVLLAARPGLLAVEPGGIPMPWLVLAVGVYPALLALAWWYVRSAERAERELGGAAGRS